MQVVIENLHQDVTDDEIRLELSPRFVPVEKIVNIQLVREGSMPTAVIEMDMTRVEVAMLAKRIDGHFHKGQRLRAWVPLW